VALSVIRHARGRDQDPPEDYSQAGALRHRHRRTDCGLHRVDPVPLDWDALVPYRPDAPAQHRRGELWRTAAAENRRVDPVRPDRFWFHSQPAPDGLGGLVRDAGNLDQPVSDRSARRRPHFLHDSRPSERSCDAGCHRRIDRPVLLLVVVDPVGGDHRREARRAVRSPPPSMAMPACASGRCAACSIRWRAWARRSSPQPTTAVRTRSLAPTTAA